MTDAAAGPTGAAGPGAAGPTGTAPENGRAGAAPPEPVVRRARSGDVRQIRDLIETYRGGRRMLSKPLVTLYEDVQEFRVAVHPVDGTVLGCGALHVMWEDLAEIRSVAVHPDWRGHRIGHRIVAELLDTAREIGVSRVFVLTFETRFFGNFGFVEIDGAPVPHAVYEQLLRSYDEGVAEFLDLERVKPNTLGNVRMLLRL
ncbi:amino-acid N-acetyltransferase [Plantactinospora sp. B5E13]|uniref:amino-acid N-acetyltransferase n=1 Tax=unclassified Plantactinospora TaxID=2631981 RepID=UPI00325EB7DB